VSLSSKFEPSNFREVVKDRYWREAMSCEVATLTMNTTWDIATIPLVWPIEYKWVYKTKRLSNNDV